MLSFMAAALCCSQVLAQSQCEDFSVLQFPCHKKFGGSHNKGDPSFGDPFCETHDDCLGKIATLDVSSKYCVMNRCQGNKKRCGKDDDCDSKRCIHCTWNHSSSSGTCVPTTDSELGVCGPSETDKWTCWYSDAWASLDKSKSCPVTANGCQLGGRRRRDNCMTNSNAGKPQRACPLHKYDHDAVIGAVWKNRKSSCFRGVPHKGDQSVISGLNILIKAIDGEPITDGIGATTVMTCQQYCEDDDSCASWTLNTEDRHCWLHKRPSDGMYKQNRDYSSAGTMLMFADSKYVSQVCRWGTDDIDNPTNMHPGEAGQASQQWPMVMTHESSSYYGRIDFYDIPHVSTKATLVKYLSDQTINVQESLKLGVRAFDIRPWKKDKQHLYMRHSQAFIDVSVSVVFDEVIEWFHGLPSGSVELVVINPQFIHGSGDDKKEARRATFELAHQYNFTVYTNSESDLGDANCNALNDAIKSPMHGVIVMDNSCVPRSGNYEPEVTCEHSNTPYLFSPPEPKCNTEMQQRLVCYIQGFAAQNLAPVPAVLQAHQQGMQAVACEKNHDINRAIVTKTLKEISSDLVGRPFFIQIDNAENHGSLVIEQVRAIQAMRT